MKQTYSLLIAFLLLSTPLQSISNENTESKTTFGWSSPSTWFTPRTNKYIAISSMALPIFILGAICYDVCKRKKLDDIAPITLTISTNQIATAINAYQYATRDEKKSDETFVRLNPTVGQGLAAGSMLGSLACGLVAYNPPTDAPKELVGLIWAGTIMSGLTSAISFDYCRKEKDRRNAEALKSMFAKYKKA